MDSGVLFPLLQFCGPVLWIKEWRFISCFLSLAVGRPAFSGRSLAVGERGGHVVLPPAPLPPGGEALRSLIQEWHGQRGDSRLFGEKELPVLCHIVIASLPSSASGWSLPHPLCIHHAYVHMLFKLIRSFFRGLIYNYVKRILTH